MSPRLLIALGFVLALSFVPALSGCSRLSAPGSFLGPGNFGGGPYVGGVASIHASSGMVSAVAGVDSVRIEWRSVGLEDFTGELGLFLSSNQGQLFDATPVVVSATQGSYIFESLSLNTEYFVGLGIAQQVGDALQQNGPVLSARTAQVFYANPDAPIAGADGLTPATAYPNVFLTVLTAQLNGGGNVWAAEGNYIDVSLPLLAGVDLYGGFTPDFDLARRDSNAHATIFDGLAGESTLKLEASADLQRVDGVQIHGHGAVDNGVDLDGTPAELRGILVQHCQRGIRLRGNALLSATDVDFVDCEFKENALEGLSLEGPFSINVDACTFVSNGQEGFQFGPWIAPSGEVVKLRVRDSRFLGNGFEGFDIDLQAAALVAPGGRFEVTIEDCDFEQNGTDGCLIDLDYDGNPFWESTLSLRGCLARANRGNGFAFDLDSTSICELHRVLSTANAMDGLSVTSESAPGFVLVSASACVGNLGRGMSSTFGNVGLALSHCILAGNEVGGVSSEFATTTAMSSATHLQPAAYGATRLLDSLELPAEPVPFLYAPVEYLRALSVNGDLLALSAPSTSQTGRAVEVAADGVLRVLTSHSDGQAELTPGAEAVALPARVAFFPLADSVDENYEPALDSSLIDAGAQLPDGAHVDAGLFGSPRAGVPGIEDLQPLELFRVSSSQPVWGQAIAPGNPYIVRFLGGAPDPDSLANGVSLIDAAGTTWPVNFELHSGALHILPPAGGFAPGDVIELHSTLLASLSGLPLIPVALVVGTTL